MWHEMACNEGQMGMSTTEGRVLTSPRIMTISVIFAYREEIFASFFLGNFMWHRLCIAQSVNRKKCAQLQALCANEPRKVGMNTAEGRVKKSIVIMTTPFESVEWGRICLCGIWVRVLWYANCSAYLWLRKEYRAENRLSTCKKRRKPMNTTEGRVVTSWLILCTSAKYASRRRFVAAFFNVFRLGKGAENG